jgi:type IVB pilus formation R64 PilN family outer membrane protein
MSSLYSKSLQCFSPSSLRRTVCVLSVCAFSLVPAACADRNAARNDVNLTAKNASSALKEVRPKSMTDTALIEESAPWFGNTTISAQSGDILPESVEAENALVMTFEKPLTLSQLVGRIQAATGMRVMVDLAANTATAGGGAGAAAGVGVGDIADGRFLPVDGLEVTGGRTLWQGKLSNLLDQVSDRFDAEWKYSNNTIHISQQVIRTFMLHALAGSTDVGGSVKTGTTGAEGGLPQQSVDSTSKLVVWDEIQKTVDSIVGTKARATYSPATGTITVAGYPSAINAVEGYLRMQNKLRLRRVALEAKVLSVQLNKNYDNNFDVDLVIRDAFNGQPFVFSSKEAQGLDVGRTIAGGIFKGTDAAVAAAGGIGAGGEVINNSRFVINALSAVANRVSVEYSGTLVTLSDQPAPLQVATKRSYVARVSGSATDGASSTTLEPGTIDIGLSMNLLPRVIEQDRIMLRIALGITDLVQLREFSSGGSSLQLPEIDTTGFLQNAVLRTGETLVLAGFEQKNANDTQQGTGHPGNWLLGGGETYGQGRAIRVLMITANVLPEDPINVAKP